MRCPFCGTDDTQVKDSRGSEDGASIRRRRLCSSCGSRFTTFERIQLRELIVVKRNGKKSIFDRDYKPVYSQYFDDDKVSKEYKVNVNCGEYWTSLERPQFLFVFDYNEGFAVFNGKNVMKY